MWDRDDGEILPTQPGVAGIIHLRNPRTSPSKTRLIPIARSRNQVLAVPISLQVSALKSPRPFSTPALKSPRSFVSPVLKSPKVWTKLVLRSPISFIWACSLLARSSFVARLSVFISRRRSRSSISSDSFVFPWPTPRFETRSSLICKYQTIPTSRQKRHRSCERVLGPHQQRIYCLS